MIRGRAFIFSICVRYDKVFEHVTLTVTFDLLLNIGHNFLIVRDYVFMFGIYVFFMFWPF